MAFKMNGFVAFEGKSPMKCWKGYERVPGTAKGSKGSCRKSSPMKKQKGGGTTKTCLPAADGVPGVYPKGKILMAAGPGSGVRSLESQEANWKAALKKYGSAKKARKWVAMPISQGGEGSPHTTGRAIDFFLGMPPSSKNNEALKSTAAYRWLVANAHKYGLAQYKGEAWHWELNKPNREYFANLMSKPEEEIGTA